MRTRTETFYVLILSALLLLEAPTNLAVAEETKTDQPFTPTQLAESTQHRRAIEAVIWGMPAVNFEQLNQAMLGAKAAPNEIVFWSRPLDWKNQTLTPNPDTIYLMPFYNTKDGPIVLE
ncbi:MAG TPA: DUF1254 domain-containing protein, partial [Lacipirellulaceae bacterium]